MYTYTHKHIYAYIFVSKYIYILHTYRYINRYIHTYTVCTDTHLQRFTFSTYHTHVLKCQSRFTLCSDQNEPQATVINKTNCEKGKVSVPGHAFRVVVSPWGCGERVMTSATVTETYTLHVLYKDAPHMHSPLCFVFPLTELNLEQQSHTWVWLRCSVSIQFWHQCGDHHTVDAAACRPGWPWKQVYQVNSND